MTTVPTVEMAGFEQNTNNYNFKVNEIGVYYD